VKNDHLLILDDIITSWVGAVANFPLGKHETAPSPRMKSSPIEWAFTHKKNTSQKAEGNILPGTKGAAAGISFSFLRR
jgi:hypothetical protein